MSCRRGEGESFVVGIGAAGEEAICATLPVSSPRRPESRPPRPSPADSERQTCTVSNYRPFASPIVTAPSQHAEVVALVRSERNTLDDGCGQCAEQEQHKSHEENNRKRSRRAQHLVLRVVGCVCGIKRVWCRKIAPTETTLLLLARSQRGCRCMSLSSTVFPPPTRRRRWCAQSFRRRRGRGAGRKVLDGVVAVVPETMFPWPVEALIDLEASVTRNLVADRVESLSHQHVSADAVC